jgi:hypothetical protein
MVERRPGWRTRVRVWVVSWRTLRRRTYLVTTTDGGDPVVSVGDERLVLPGRARHFRRFVSCALCGAEFVGSHAVLSFEELRRPSTPAVCTGCSRAGRFQPDA